MDFSLSVSHSRRFQPFLWSKPLRRRCADLAVQKMVKASFPSWVTPATHKVSCMINSACQARSSDAPQTLNHVVSGSFNWGKSHDSKIITGSTLENPVVRFNLSHAWKEHRKSSLASRLAGRETQKRKGAQADSFPWLQSALPFFQDQRKSLIEDCCCQIS